MHQPEAVLAAVALPAPRTGRRHAFRPFPGSRIATLVEALESALASLDGDRAESGLGDLRVALRRTAAAARVFRGFPRTGDGVEVEERARTLRRALSVRRQIAASLVLVGQLPIRHRFRANALLGASRFRGPSLADVRYDVRALLVPLVDWRDRLLAWSAGADDRRCLLEKVARRIEKSRERVTQLGVPAAGSLHEYRVAVKELRDRLEIAAPLLDGAEALAERCRKLQKELGPAADWVSLASDLAATPGEPGTREDASLLEEVAAMRAAAERRALRAVRRHRRELRDARLRTA